MDKPSGEVIDFPSGQRVERRSSRRLRTLKTGILKFHRDFCVLECVVRNVSGDGARLKFAADTLAVPMRFDVKVGDDGEWRPAVVRWRGLTDIGVSFAAA